MKQLFVFSLIICVAFANAQNRVHVPKHLREISLKVEAGQTAQQIIFNENIPYKQSKAITLVDEEEIGDTRYDNQSNASIPKKIVLFEDGTIGATWTRSMEEGSFFADRGTGYNYFNGTEWGEWPSERVEDIKVHRPVYAQWGENGEMLISHTSGAGLYMATCPEKGTGDWDFETISGPPGEDYILWARAVTSGVNHGRIHLLSLTLPESHGGTPYEGLDGALLYSLSLDGGESWEIEHEILDGMTSDEYNGFPGDTYVFAEPKDDVVAFVAGDPWKELFLMKSIDGGLNFEKTIIWEHPYPDWEFGMTADTFYCADGSHSLVIDDNGMVNVAFGISRVHADDAGTYWYPWEDGIAFWNEDMPAFSNGLNTLNPYGHPDSELTEDYNLIGWTQDINNNGSLEFMDEMGIYSIGLSSMPQLILDGNEIYLVYSSVTETFSNGLKNYRHIWARSGKEVSGSWLWNPNFEHLSGDLVHLFDECVYPAVAANSDENIHLIFQVDSEPGIATWYAQHEYVDNKIVYLKESKDIVIGTKEQDSPSKNLSVEQNYPNPFHHSSIIIAENNSPGFLGIKIYTTTGKVVYEELRSSVQPGKHIFKINGERFSEGLYFYTISDRSSSITKKMMIR